MTHIIIRALHMTHNAHSPDLVQMKLALVIVDVQNDFARPDGALSVPSGEEIIPIINRLRDHPSFHRIILTQDFHPQHHISFYSTHQHDVNAQLYHPLTLINGTCQILWPDHCIQGTSGVLFHPDLIVKPTDIIIRKGSHVNVDSYSAFMDNDKIYSTELDDILKGDGIERIIIVGLAYDYCVGFTAIDGYQLGYDVIILSDATRAVNQLSSQRMTNRLTNIGVIISDSINYIDNNM